MFAPGPCHAAIAKPCSAVAGGRAGQVGGSSAPPSHTGIQAGIQLCFRLVVSPSGARRPLLVLDGKLVTSAHGPLARKRLPGVGTCVLPLLPLHEAFSSKEAWQAVSLAVGGHRGFGY